MTKACFIYIEQTFLKKILHNNSCYQFGRKIIYKMISIQIHLNSSFIV